MTDQKDAHTMACRMLDAAILTYDIVVTEQGYPAWQTTAATPRLLANLGLPDETPAWFATGDDKINAGFVGVTSDGLVVLGIRGTLPPGTGDPSAWIMDWLNDFKAGPTDWELPGGAKIGQIEKGFAEAAHSLWRVAETPLKAAVAKAPKPTRIVIAGHSKGAALVYPIASLVETLYPSAIEGIYAYATPMTADQAFASWFETAGLTAKTTRYQNKDDLVPFLPVWPKFDIWEKVKVKLAATADASFLSDEYVLIGSLVYLAGTSS
ncbi:MAG: lipase family protein, partial [Pseudomonadota bacterium]